MKKMFGFFVLGMFLISMGMGFVSAGPIEDIKEVVESVYDVFKPVLEQIIGTTVTTDIFLAKILFLIIIFSIVWKSLEKVKFFEETTWVLWIVSTAVSILAIRWVGNAELINSILLPYSAFGIALTAGLPFVLYFFIVKDFTKTLRKVSWVFFITVFTGLWFMRSTEVGTFGYIYLATVGLAFLVLMFDGTIQNIMTKAKIDRIGALHGSRMAEEMNEIMKKRKELYHSDPDGYASYYEPSLTGDKAYDSDMKRIKKAISKLKQ